MLNRMFDLTRAIPLVHDDSDRARGVGAEDRGNRIGAALEKDADTLAGLYAVCLQMSSKSTGACAQLSQCDSGVSFENCSAIGFPVGRVPEDVGQVGMIIRHGN